MSDRKESFTPGPWFCTCIGHVKECMGDPPKTVATIPGFCSEVKMDGITEKQANADLIAAAPEMYELLQRLSHALFAEDADEWTAEIKSLLAKANGVDDE